MCVFLINLRPHQAMQLYLFAFRSIAVDEAHVCILDFSRVKRGANNGYLSFSKDLGREQRSRSASQAQAL